MKRPDKNDPNYLRKLELYCTYLEQHNMRLSKSQTRPKPVIWNDKKFRSLEEMARHLKCNPQNLRYYIKNDKPFAGAYIDYDFN